MEDRLSKVIDKYYARFVGGIYLLLLTVVAIFPITTDFVPDEDAGFFVVYTQGMEAGSSIRMLNMKSRWQTS